MAERAMILIDGSNFYHRLKELRLRHLLSFDYAAFAKFLCGEKRKLAGCTYYIGAVREEVGNAKSQQLMANQVRLINRLRQQKWGVRLGEMLQSDGIYHEKGVDVRMAVDLVAGAYEDLYDTAILVSSDSDLIPALEKVRSKKKNVTYVGFSHKPSHALIAHSNIRRLLTREDLEQFLPAQEL
ncbi:MAG: NYN domain-containing protein [Patescibacteria group bacterium]